MKKMNNNKGAAMVTVLIAVSFIIILATSLLYMTYMNYITKGLKYGSTDNFYVDEFALDDLATTIQQIAANSTSMGDAIDNIKTSAGVYTASTGAVCYNNNNVAAMIQVASKEATISVNTAVSVNAAGVPISSNFIQDGNQVKFLGVQITATTEEGYQSTITTDIILGFPGTGVGDMDVNDFSVITDSPVTVVTGDVVMSGNVYMSRDFSSADTSALRVQGTAAVEILSRRGIINGDIIIEEGGVLCITGIVTVIGDIDVDGVLICSGTLEATGDVDVASDGRLLGSVTEGATVDTALLPPNYSNSDYSLTSGVTGALFDDVWMYDGSDWEEVALADYIDAKPHGEFSATGVTETVRLGLQGTENGMSNTLVLSTEDVTIRDAFDSSTCVCAGRIIFDIASAPTYMQCMSDEAYENAKSVVLSLDSFNFGSLNNTPFNGGFTMSNMTHPDDATARHDTSRSDYTYTDGSGDEQPLPYIYSSGNEVPAGFFISEHSSTIISDMFAAAQGDVDQTVTTIYFVNWEKN
ncbi:MAG: hypothetical protein IJZ00_07465 [Lachnospiraceae bacterium]|nr:hypothetical protein [Lachnospiraceae bacterium]